MKRCAWVNLNNEKYVAYHDNEWGRPSYDDKHMFEMLILEGFQAGLSWETILNKRENFRAAFDDFDVVKVSEYGEEKFEELMNNAGIVRNRRKITAATQNAKAFIEIQKEYGSFSKYIWSFTDGKVILNEDDKFKTTSELSDKVSKDLKKRGMNFVGSTIIYSYLQSIGIINDHELECDFRGINMFDMFEKRRATAGDIAEIYKLIDPIFSIEQGIPVEMNPIPEERTPQWWCMTKDGRIVASAAIFFDGGRWHMGRIALAKELRGQHLGTDFLKYVLDEVFAQGIEGIYLEARPTTVHIFEKFGAKQAGEIFDFYGGALTPIELKKEDYLG